MTPDQLFQIASQAAIAGWVLLGASMFLPRPWSARALMAAGRWIPIALCIAYVAALAVWWGSATGGFGSLDAVASLFSSKGVLLAGWMHYLAFDLLLGRWQVDRVLAMPNYRTMRWFALPCLFATLMFGPGGLLLFLLLASAAGRFSPARGVAA